MSFLSHTAKMNSLERVSVNNIMGSCRVLFIVMVNIYDIFVIL